MNDSLNIIIGKFVFQFLKQFHKLKSSDRQHIIDAGENGFLLYWNKIYGDEK